MDVQKSNILMLGPTGSGKTYLAQTLAKILNVPFAIADATALTEAGYVGEDVENILLKADPGGGLRHRTVRSTALSTSTRSTRSPKSQRMSPSPATCPARAYSRPFLKILEGTVASVPPQGGRKHPHQELIQIDTTNILFICGGAFDGLEKIVETAHQTLAPSALMRRSWINRNDMDIDELLRKVEPQDLTKFGLIPEFIGRVPVMVSLELLTEEAMVRILSEPKNALIKQYQKLFELDNVKLEFTQGSVGGDCADWR